MDDFIVDDEEDASDSSEFNVKQQFQRLVSLYKNYLSLHIHLIFDFTSLSAIPLTLLVALIIVLFTVRFIFT
jgi:hypothetical protein